MWLAAGARTGGNSVGTGQLRCLPTWCPALSSACCDLPTPALCDMSGSDLAYGVGICSTEYRGGRLCGGYDRPHQGRNPKPETRNESLNPRSTPYLCLRLKTPDAELLASISEIRDRDPFLGFGRSQTSQSKSQILGRTPKLLNFKP
eukprot:3847796-Rhodomonas_salina.8